MVGSLLREPDGYNVHIRDEKTYILKNRRNGIELNEYFVRLHVKHN